MDINSLLSPADSPADETPPPTATSSTRASPVTRHGRPTVQQRKSSGLSQTYSRSPRAGEQSLPSIAAHNAAYQSQQAAYAPTSNPNSPLPQGVYGGGTATPPNILSPGSRHTPVHPVMQRHGSTPQMDTLADLASMQKQQQSTPAPSMPTRETKPAGYNLQNLPRPPLPARSSNEIVMTDPATQERRSFRARALSEEDCNTLGEVGNHLVTNPFDYTSHVRFISLLQQGFAVHAGTGANLADYELLKELRDARVKMDQIFPLGEGLWVSWLEDEMALARNVEERSRLMELFGRAISDEPSSVRLWRKYGDYAYYLWATSYGIDEPPPSDPWSTHDLQVGKEFFKWGPMLRIWEDAVSHTHFRLNDSQLVWDQYIGVLIQDHAMWPDRQKITNIRNKFFERLGEAHATWEETYQNYGQFLSKHDAQSYEEDMARISQNRGAQTAWRIREKFETAIQQAAQQGDETAEYNAYAEYLQWELEKKGVFSFRMIHSMFERATVRFPTVQSIWVDYIDFLQSDATTGDFPIMQVIDRATRHCPWSGDLWAHKLLIMEQDGQPFSEIEKIKHRATSTGLLDVGGMEELMKVYVAWCGGLRRRAFVPGASEDELDIAEVAIRSALEHVKKIGQDKYGDKYAGDPHYRLERIYIKFMMQKGEVDVARDSFKELRKVQANYYNFWYRFYIFEMVVWAKFSMRAEHEPETQLQPPSYATSVLEDALEHIETMDWPEQLVPMYLNHCEHHESVSVLRRAVIKSRVVNKLITKRREKEAAEAATAYPQQTPAASVPAEEPQTNGKRKREDEEATSSTISKKAKSDEPAPDESLPVTSQLKRDREHTTVIVENIPAASTEAKIGRFFEDCGTIKSLKLVTKNDLQTATIEFENQDEASYSLMKSGKVFEGNELKVNFGTGTTIFITNYPPEADKAYITDLFKDCGEIVDIRMPSLKANTRRRFAYVQFSKPEQAEEAIRLDGKVLSDKYKLKAAISDPTKAGDRGGAQAEGREVFVGNVYWYATEDDLKTLFEFAGEIESVRIPRNLEGKSKAIAFVVFKDKEGANKSVEKFNDIEFKNRKLHVEVSAKGRTSRTATNVHRQSTMSPGPEGASPSDLRSVRSVTADPDGSSKDHKERTVAVMNVPDTVTRERLEKLCEQYGQIRKFVLRPDHAGAIVEYVDKAGAGKAQMALAEYEFDDRKLRVGTVPELMKEKEELKEGAQTWTAPKKKKEQPGAQKAQLASFGAPIARPGQGARGRGGRRGGLGFSKRAKPEEAPASGPKSNDYFRDLMAGKAAPKEDEAAPPTANGNGDGDDDGLLDDLMAD